MSCLTEYRRPHPRYATDDAGWRSKTPWEIVEGKFQRLYIVRRKYTPSRWRRAEIFRKAGVWSWHVLERTGAQTWREISRESCFNRSPYFSAQQAMPFAELAAITK